jgi:hypothetical protein
MLLAEAEAVVAKVEPLEGRAIEESLGIKLVNVIFHLLKVEQKAKEGRAIILQPEWLAKLQAAGGYQLDGNEFSASFGKDERIMPGLKITVEMTSLE